MSNFRPAVWRTNFVRNKTSTSIRQFTPRGSPTFMTTTTITEQNERLKAQQVVENDLEYICTNLNEEFPELAGRRLLITGGAGFLGHYLVQSALYWNRTRSGPAIDVTVFDSYIRGVPDWLKQLEDNPHLHLRTHNLAQPLPAEMGEFEYI